MQACMYCYGYTISMHSRIYLWKGFILLILPRGIGSSRGWHENGRGLDQKMCLRIPEESHAIHLLDAQDVLFISLDDCPKARIGFVWVMRLLLRSGSMIVSTAVDAHIPCRSRDEYSWHPKWGMVRVLTTDDLQYGLCDAMKGIYVPLTINFQKYVNWLRLQRWRCQFNNNERSRTAMFGNVWDGALEFQIKTIVTRYGYWSSGPKLDVPQLAIAFAALWAFVIRFENIRSLFNCTPSLSHRDP